jgi:uncharacterized RDD family membrane protein YckC
MTDEGDAIEETEEPSASGWYTDPTGLNEMRYWDGSEWTQHTAYPHQASPETPPEPVVVLSGFWRRSLAFVFDGMVLGGAGALIGSVLFEPLANLGAWGRLLGFIVSALYFVSLDSSLGNGQTLGKQIARIRVVDGVGNTISPRRAAVRYSLLAAPVYLNGLPIQTSATTGVLGIVLGIVLFGLGGAAAYLYIFNRRTRQSVHDLATGTFVVRKSSIGPIEKSIWRPHLAIASALFAVALVASVAGSVLASSALPNGLIQSIEAIEDTGDVHNASVFIGKSWNSTTVTEYVEVRVVLKEHPDDREAMARKIANMVLDEFPDANKVDLVQVVLTRGYDIGIASGWSSTVVYRSPSEWRDDVEE